MKKYLVFILFLFLLIISVNVNAQVPPPFIQGISLPSCSDNGNVLTYSTTTKKYSCQPVTGTAANPGGDANQIQYNSGGDTFAGFTMSGDCTLVVATGAITCTKSSGTSFGTGAFATIANYATLNSPTFTGTVSGITATMVGLGNVTNNAQTQAAIVPNTAPAAGQMLIGNSGGTAYAPVAMSGDATIDSTGAITVAKFGGTAFGDAAGHAASDFVLSSRTINGHALTGNVIISASDLTTGTLPHAQLPALLSADIPSITAGATYLLNLSAASPITGQRYGLELPAWDDNVPSAGYPITYDHASKAIKIYDDGWNSIGSSGAPVDPSYITLGTNGTLTSERVLTMGTSMYGTDGGAGSTYTINTIQDIRTSATPQFARLGIGVAADGTLLLKVGGATDYATISSSGALAFGGAGTFNFGSDARGDIPIRGASVYGRLGIGASGKILASNGTDPGWSAYTLAAPGAQYALLSSDGTNWTRLATSANITSFLGSADYAAARTALGLAIGTNVQAYDADLTTYAGITPSANVQSLLGAATYSAMRTLLSLVPGTNIQAYDADLSTYAGITPSANIQTLLGSADFAAARTNLGLAIGTNVQAYSGALASIAALTETAGGMLYTTSDNTYAVLAAGSTGQLLRHTGTAPAYTTLTMPATIAAGSVFAANSANVLSEINSTSGTKFLRNNAGTISWETGVGTISGSTGSTDNVILTADGTGGATLQANPSGASISDAGLLTITSISAATGAFTVSSSGSTSVLDLTVTGPNGITVSKQSGVAGDMGLFEANSTDTDTAGFRGALSMTANTSYRGRMPNARATSDKMVLAWTNGSETGTGTPSDPYVQTMSFIDLDTYLALAGGTLTGKLITATNGTAAGINLTQSSGAPSSPVNGDIWITASGLYAYVNGSAVGPFSTDSPAFGSVTAGTNTNALVIGTSGSLSTSGSGTIAATSSASLSISGQTGLLTFTGITSTNRAKTVRDAADTILELGGSYTPTGTWDWGSATWSNVPIPTAVTVADTTDTTSYVALFESATGDLGPKTDAGITYNAGTGVLTATGFAGPLTGDITIHATGVKVTGDGDGAITFLGLGDGSDEDLTLNFDDVSNEVGVSSSTGVTKINMGSIGLASTGSFQGAVAINSDANGMSPSEMAAVGLYNTMFFATGAGTWALPTAAAGMNFCVYSTTAAAIVINPDDSDDITLNGTLLDDGDSITSASGAGDFICLIAIDATHWYTMGRSGTWTDTN